MKTFQKKDKVMEECHQAGFHVSFSYRTFIINNLQLSVKKFGIGDAMLYSCTNYWKIDL